MNIGMKTVLALSFFCAAPAWADAPAPRPVQQQSQQSLQDLDPKRFVDAASTLINAIDAGQAGTIWDAASPVLKSAGPRDQFIAGMRQRVTANGVISRRQWYAITRVHNATRTPKLPEGDYLNVAFVGTNKAGAAVRGTVSFRLEPDAVWRLAGYAL